MDMRSTGTVYRMSPILNRLADKLSDALYQPNPEEGAVLNRKRG